MNKRRIPYLLLCISILFQQDIHAQSQTYGSSKVELATDITSSSNGFLFLNSAQKNGADFDLWAIFVDTSSNFISEKKYGGQQKDIAAQISPTSNGYFVLGTTYSSELPEYHGKGDFLLIRTDVAGSQIWRKLYGGAKLDRAVAIASTGDGGAILTGMTHSSDVSSYSYGQADILLIKVDAGGQVEWSKTYGGSKTDYPTDIQLTADGGFILSGTTFSQDGNISSNNGHSDIWVLKLTHSGDIQWSKSFGNNTFDYGHAIQPIASGGYIVVGATSATHPNEFVIEDRYDQDLVAIKINESGQVVWQKTYGQERFDAALDVYSMNDNGFLLTGYSEDANSLYPYHTFKNAWTLKLDDQGNKLWEIFSHGSKNEVGVAIGTNPSQTVIAVLGNTDSKDGDLISSGKKDIWASTYNDQAVPFSVSIGNDFGICSSKNILLNATIPNCSNCTYLWEDNSTEAIRPIKPTETKEYTVTVTNSSGLTATDAIIISVFDAPTVSVIKNNPLIGESNGYIIITPQGGTPDYQILWDHGPINYFVNQLSEGDYHFLLTDNNGCSVNSTITLQGLVASQELTQKNELKLYPNPAQEQTNLHIQSSETIKFISIYNTTGILIQEFPANQQNIQLEHLPKGAYYLSFHLLSGALVTKKLHIY